MRAVYRTLTLAGEMVPLRELGEWSGGSTPSKSNPGFWSNGTIPWVSPKDMIVETITSSEDHITKEAIDCGRLRVAPAGSVLVVTRSGILQHTLPVAVTTVPVTINQDIKALVPGSKVSPKYVALALQASAGEILSRCSKQGTTVSSVETNKLLDFCIPLVSPVQQNSIVAEIEKQFSRIDEAVANLKRVKANLKRYKASVLKAAYRGVLTSKRSTQESPAGVLPEGWAWSTIGECFRVEVGATPSRKEPGYWNGNIPWVSSGEVQFGRIFSTRESITEAGLSNSSTRINPAGSVLIGMIGQGRTRAQSAILEIDATNNQNCAAIWVSETDTPPQYVFYWLMSRYEETRGEGSGNNQQALNKRAVQKIPIPMPPIAEQRLIVSEVERIFSVTEELETQIATNLKRAEGFRHAILQRSFCERIIGNE